MLLLITRASWSHPVKWKRRYSKYWIVGIVKHVLGTTFGGRRHSQEVYTNIITQLLQRVHTSNATDFRKPVTTWEPFSKTSTEKTSVWAPSENRAGPKANLKPVCSSGTVCPLRTTLAEVLGLPPSPTKTYLHPSNATPASQHEDLKTWSFWLQVGQQEECGHVPLFSIFSHLYGFIDMPRIHMFLTCKSSNH